MSTTTDATLTAVTEAEHTIQQQLAAAERTRDSIERAHGEAAALVEQAHRDGTQAGQVHAAALVDEAERQARRIRQDATQAAQRLSTDVTARRADDVAFVATAVASPT